MNMTNYISGFKVYVCVCVSVSVFEHFTMENRNTFHTSIISI
jgi:hypothetical protein